MLKLIKLEWKKNNVWKQIRNAAVTTGVLLALLLMAAGELEREETVQAYGKSMLDVSVGMFVHVSYIVFTGVMIASYLVGAYEKKTINLMFSYPIRRSRIVLAKIFAVWIFNFAAMTVSKAVISFVLIFTRSSTGITAAGLSIGEPSFWLEAVLGSAAMVSISFLALPIGLKMRSSKAAIVASVIIVCFTQGGIGSATLANNMTFYAVLFVTAIVSVYLSICRLETRDVM